MIAGHVTAGREAVIRLTIWGPDGRVEELNVVIDTGFDGYLSLPAAVIGHMGLPYVCRADVTLADGSNSSSSLYIAAVDWDGTERHVSVLRAEGGPLVGMGLLQGFDLHVRVIKGGSVTIDRIHT